MNFSKMCWPTLTYLIFSVFIFIFFIINIFSELINGGVFTSTVFLIWVFIYLAQVYVWCKVLTILCHNNHKMLAWLLWLWLPLLSGAIGGVALVAFPSLDETD
tara:strand:- start:206 stop:514 length:309 start_codon:yes stop_codon:yes gene_type:complete